MKTTTLPTLRVSPELRASAEAVLAEGETLSAFLLDAVTRSIESRRARQAFLERGLRSRELARRTDGYVDADVVLEKLRARASVSPRKRRA